MNEQHLIDYVLKLVRRLISEKNLAPRSRAIVVIKALGFPNPRTVRLQLGADGARSGRQILISDQLTCWERIEFTLFHELLHILLEEDGEVISQLLDHFYHHTDSERTRVLENLCNIGAAEFIMPASEYIEVMRAGEWKLTTLPVAAQTFQASVIACGFQFAHHNPDRCIVVVCEQGTFRTKPYNLAFLDKIEKPCLHIAYVAYHPEEEYRMCRNVPIPSGHPISHAWKNGTELIGSAPGFFSTSRAWNISCEIACIGSRVFAAYYPKGRKYQTGQASLFE